MKHGAKRKFCREEGCTNFVVRAGVCIRHGAKRGRCTIIEGKHGSSKNEEAAVEDINEIICREKNRAVNAAIQKWNLEKISPEERNECNRNEEAEESEEEYDIKKWKRGKSGRVRRICSRQGCANLARKGGVCIRHGAKEKRCSVEGCTNKAQTAGVCDRHGSHRKICSVEGCTNNSQQGGVCKRHGAKVKIRDKCSREGCECYAVKGGVCWKHGANLMSSSRKKSAKNEGM